jgi:hypothetical protein
MGTLAIGPNSARVVISKFAYRGTVEGDRIVLTREMTSAADDPWVLGSHKVEFSLERMK